MLLHKTNKWCMPTCGIRKCAKKKGIDACPFCDEYPCKRILDPGKGYVTLIADGRHMKETGLEAWKAEQEERRRTGFCYLDIRVPDYSDKKTKKIIFFL